MPTIGWILLLGAAGILAFATYRLGTRAIDADKGRLEGPDKEPARPGRFDKLAVVALGILGALVLFDDVIGILDQSPGMNVDPIVALAESVANEYDVIAQHVPGVAIDVAAVSVDQRVGHPPSNGSGCLGINRVATTHSIAVDPQAVLRGLAGLSETGTTSITVQGDTRRGCESEDDKHVNIEVGRLHQLDDLVVKDGDEEYTRDGSGQGSWTSRSEVLPDGSEVELLVVYPELNPDGTFTTTVEFHQRAPAKALPVSYLNPADFGETSLASWSTEITWPYQIGEVVMFDWPDELSRPRSFERPESIHESRGRDGRSITFSSEEPLTEAVSIFYEVQRGDFVREYVRGM